MVDISADILRIVQRIESRVSSVLSTVVTMEDFMSAELDHLKLEVAESRTVIDGAVTLITGLAEQIRDLKDDPVALEALAQELDDQQSTLAKAVQAGTEG